jgi:hypothetical protein
MIRRVAGQGSFPLVSPAPDAQICSGTGLTTALICTLTVLARISSVPGLGSISIHICTGTGLGLGFQSATQSSMCANQSAPVWVLTVFVVSTMRALCAHSEHHFDHSEYPI